MNLSTIPGGVRWDAAAFTAEFSFYAPGTIRLRFAFAQDQTNHYDSVLLPRQACQTECVPTSEGMRLESGDYAVQIDAERDSAVFSLGGHALARFCGASGSGEQKQICFERDFSGRPEHFYGLGSAGEGADFPAIDWRDSVFRLWLSDHNKHAITPLFLSTAGYGLFLNSAYDGSIAFEKALTITLRSGTLDLFFFFGPNLAQVLERFTLLTGRMALPPLSSLGITLRGQYNWTAQQLLDATDRFRKAGLPLDTLGLEPGWHTHAYPCTYAWSDRFPDPAAFVQQVHQRDLKLNLWEHPYLSEDCSIAQEMRPYCVDGAGRVRQDFEGGMCYGFGGLIPDFTLSAARELFWKVQDQNLASIGVDGYKIDETDSWGAPDDASFVFPSGCSAIEYHNLLGTLTSNLIHEKYRSQYNRRTFLFSRGNYTGMHRFASSAYTDYFAFDQFVRAVLASAFCGTYFSPEMRSAEESDNVLYRRRIQMMMFTPFALLDEWIDGQLVLDRPEEVLENYRTYVQMHYALIPYTYSCFYQQHQTGMPVVRPLPLIFQEDSETYAIDHQFLLGPSLMACPVNSPSLAASRRVYLPRGADWMDGLDGTVYHGGQWIDTQTGPDEMPLYYRLPAILPLSPPVLSTRQGRDSDRILDCFPGPGEVEFSLYDDDGESFDYEQGAYCQTPLKLTCADGSVTLHIGQRQGAYQPAERRLLLRMHYRARPTCITLNGQVLPEQQWRYEEGENDFHKVILLTLPDDAAEKTLVFTLPPAPKAVKKPRPHAPFLPASPGPDGMLVNLPVSKKGTYPVELRLSGTGQAKVRINDGPLLPLTLAKEQFLLPTPLEEGDNILCFQSTEVSLEGVLLAPNPQKQRKHIAPSLPLQEGLSGNLLIAQVFGAPLGHAVQGFGRPEDQLHMEPITVSRDAPGLVEISFSNPGPDRIRLFLSVNGASPITLDLPATGSPCLFQTISVTAYWTTGENRLALWCESPCDLSIGGIWAGEALRAK